MAGFVRVILLVFVFTIFCNSTQGQNFASRNSWKKQQQEFIFGFGAGNFLGDLGGRNAIGTDYSPIDLELSLTRPAAMIGYRYRFTKSIAMRLQADYLRLWGDDKLTTEPFRNNRNLFFRTDIFEMSANIEYAFYREKKGNRYHLKHTFKRRSKAYSSYFFLFAGVGGFYFNPKARIGGSWVALQPLGTEGQGVLPGTKKYKRVSISVPLGLGYKVTVNQQWAIGIEVSYRITFTDYIDDVSTTYYDNAALAQAKGPLAAELADPNLGNFAFQLDASGKTRSGLQRGDSKQNDAFMGVLLTGGYYLKSTKGKKKTRSKF